MFSADDILVIGDSFCSDRTNPQSYLTQLGLKLTGNNSKIRGEGFPGASWWSVRKRLLEELKIKLPKVLILAHTEPMRLPHDDDLPLNNASVENLSLHTKSVFAKELQVAGQLYYKHLFCKDFHLYMQDRWFSELDAVLETAKIPYVVHMHCFPSWEKDTPNYVFKYGATIEEVLCNYTVQSLQPNINKHHGINHFSPAMNENVANCLYDLITRKYSTGLVKLGL